MSESPDGGFALPGLRIKRSDREAFGYLAMGMKTAILFVSTILTIVLEGGLDACQYPISL